MFKPSISPGLKQKTLEGPTAEALRDTRQDMSVRVELAQVLRVGASCRLTYDLFLRRGEGDEGNCGLGYHGATGERGRVGFNYRRKLGLGSLGALAALGVRSWVG